MIGFLKNKKNIIICLCALIIIGLIIFIVCNSSSQEKKLEKDLRRYAKVYYEDVYYKLINEDKRVDFLSSYTTIGIKADLENLVRAIDGVEGVESSKTILENFVNKKTKEPCNKAKTKVTIYPTDPFGKTDYKLEINLDCGFEK